MKKLILIILSIAMVLSLVACGNNDDTSNTNQPEKDIDEVTSSKKITQSMSQFEELLSTQPLAVIKTDYVVQDEQYKSLYPDMLQAIIKNNTTVDIKDAVIAFVAWDENNLPVKITGDIDFSDGSYIKKVNYSDINLVGGATFGDGAGYQIGENNNIKTFKAIVVSFETFDGDTWENAYIDAFFELYEGKKLSDDLTVDVQIVDNEFDYDNHSDNSSNDDSSETDEEITAEELESILSEQPLAVIKTDYVVQDEQYKSLYPDMLQAIIKNNTTVDIKDAVIAFVAWDENNLPVKITGDIDFSDGSYIKKVNYSDINLVDGATFGDESGYQISENNNIKTFKAIVVSYETFDGELWDNPYYTVFSDIYGGKKLN